MLIFTFIFITLLFLIPSLVLLVEVLSAVFYTSKSTLLKKRKNDNIVSFIVLVPAHNEESILGQTLNSLLAHVPDAKQILVVADNCTDTTAEIARKSGVKVLKRFSQDLKGKGYALDYGIQHLMAAPPDVLIVMDADCHVLSGTLLTLVSFAHAQQRPVQSKYIMELGETPGRKNRVATLAFLFKNYIRPLGLNKIGLPCLLTGTGMAFPWAILKKVNFATGNIVEDMQLGIDMAKADHSPLFCEEVTVASEFPDEAVATLSQRTRWEHGHLQTIFSQIPGLIKEAVRQARLDLFILALDIAVPPLSFFILLLTGFIVAAVGVALLGGPMFIIALASTPLFVLIVAILLGWSRFGRKILPTKMLLAVPLFVLWKIPVYLNFLVNPEKEWVRTDRKKK